jgi:predicted metal-dependent peptidase
MLCQEPFYGFLILRLNKKWSDDIATAGVKQQGLNFELLINKEFWYNLPDNEKYGVLSHEMHHLAFYHLFLRKNFSDYQLYNIAADLEVNCYINNKYQGANWITIYSLKLSLPPKQGSKFYYEQLKKDLEKSELYLKNSSGSKGKNEGEDNNDQYYGGDKKNGSKKLREVYESCKVHDWKDIENSDLVKDQLDYHLTETYKACKEKGSIPGELEELLKNLLEEYVPAFNWKAYFRRVLGNSFEIYTKKTNYKESNRFTDSPGVKLKKKLNILVGIDTSGSVGKSEFKEFFNEIQTIYKAGIAVDIFECDTRVYPKWKYKGDHSDIKIHGRGGTEFDPVVKYFNEYRNNYTAFIYFTDGYCSLPTIKPLTRIIWVISSDGSKQDYPGYPIYIPKTK